ncbi:unnamed protein product, partial [Musa hybrid cultivar]
ESGGRSGTRNANRTATFPSDGSDYISSLVMASPKYVRAFCHQVVQPDLLIKRNGLYALNGGGIWNPMLDWEDRRRFQLTANNIDCWLASTRANCSWLYPSISLSVSATSSSSVPMGAEVVVMGELPLVPPIKTTPIRDKPAEGRRPEVTSTDDDDCVTPKSEEHVLKPLLVCPPAPKKPKPARRAQVAPSREFCAVPRDLTSVFLSLPPKKRIRVV